MEQVAVYNESMDIEQVHQAYKDIVLENEELKNGDVYQAGYYAGKRHVKELNEYLWKTKYENLLNQFRNCLVSEAQYRIMYDNLLFDFQAILNHEFDGK